MTIYECKCRNCSETFEKVLSISDNKNDIKCPKCGGKNIERIPSTSCDYSSQESCFGRFYST